MSKLPIAVLAALFALGSSSAVILGSAQQAPTSHPGLLASAPAIAAADNDENEQGDEGDHHDNGKHKGWYKHKKSSSSAHGLRGTITGINGNMVTLQLTNGQSITVNDQAAINNGMAPNLFVGEHVRLAGNYGQDGIYYANTIAQTNTNSGQYGYNNNGNNPYGACGANYGGQRETVVGYATGGLDGNGNFGLQTTPVQNIPIPVGPRYTVHVNGSTCLNGAQAGGVQLDLGRHIKVTGVPAGGNTINATNIWYV